MEPLLPQTAPRRNAARLLDSYRYFRGKGLACIVTAGLLDLARAVLVLFLVASVCGATSFRQLHGRIHHRVCPDGQANHADIFRPDCFGYWPVRYARLLHMPAPLALVLALGAALTAVRAFRLLASIPGLLATQHFYHVDLRLNDTDLQTASFDDVVQRIRRHEGIDELLITNTITRKDDYFLALHSTGTLRSTLPWSSADFLPSTLEQAWHTALDRAVYSHGGPLAMAGDDVGVAAARLRRQLRMLGILHLLLLPVALVMRATQLAFQHANEWRSTPTSLGLRQWTPAAAWRTRGYCEPEHVHRERLARAHRPATQYVAMFHSELTAQCAAFGVFATGGALVMLLILALLFDEGMLTVALTHGRTVTWWLGVLGVAFSVARALVPDENVTHAAATKLAEVTRHTHYLPPAWRAREHEHTTQAAFTAMFAYRWRVVLDELLGVLLAPYYLLHAYPQQAGTVCRMLADIARPHALASDICVYALLQVADAAEPSVAPADSFYARYRPECSDTHVAARHSDCAPSPRHAEIQPHYDAIQPRHVQHVGVPNYAGAADIGVSAIHFAERHPTWRSSSNHTHDLVASPAARATYLERSIGTRSDETSVLLTHT